MFSGTYTYVVYGNKITRIILELNPVTGIGIWLLVPGIKITGKNLLPREVNLSLNMNFENKIINYANINYVKVNMIIFGKFVCFIYL